MTATTDESAKQGRREADVEEGQPLSTPDLHLRTLFVLNGAGRIVSARKPGRNRGALFSLVRSRASCAWAVREDVSEEIAGELDQLAREEPPISDFRDAPMHAKRYVSLLRRIYPGQEAGNAIRLSAGPAFEFPEKIAQPSDVVAVEDERLLHRHFRWWVVGEMAAGRSPVMATLKNGHPVSICFCARSSDSAAEAGVETAEAFRARGFAPRVTAAWALAIRASGRIPLYSTSWSNSASLSVARRLGLRVYASGWSLSQ